MVQKLGELGYLNYEKYRGLVLTEKGLAVATKIKKRHETLSRFFSLLGLDANIQKHDIEGIEHHLSPETVDVLADLAAFFEKNPEIVQRFLKSRRGKRESCAMRVAIASFWSVFLTTLLLDCMAQAQ